MITDNRTNQFISDLIAKIKNERIFELITEDWKQNYKKYNGRWDTPARQKIGNIARLVFKKNFPEQDLDVCFYVEGQGTPSLWQKPTKLFGSAGVYPDIAILRPKRIAIELDHSEKGSGLKMALAKAAFNYLSGQWDCCFVFFYDHKGKLNIDGETETRICSIYEEEFKTKIVIFK